MESFPWDKCFLTGIADVDSQHRRLVEIINNFGDVVARDEGDYATAIESVLNELTEYANYHFAEEESFMEARRVDERHVQPHKEAHAEFIEAVTQMREGAADAKSDAGEQILKFLIHWLAYHILGTDQSLARQIAAIEVARAPADAFVEEERVRALSTGPLLDALNGLFQQVSKRNRQLSDLNRTLEQRVAERTQKLSEANARLEAIAMTDALTGLPNRRHALSALEREWHTATRQGGWVSCMMIDADDFKRINDTYGHEAGDEVLRRLARELRHSVRTDDIAARLGGDEFLIICPGTDLAGSLRIAEKVRASVASMSVTVGDGSWQGSVSVGVSVRTDAMLRPEDLIKAADEGVYLAKNAGRNCVRTPS